MMGSFKENIHSISRVFPISGGAAHGRIETFSQHHRSEQPWATPPLPSSIG